MLCAELIHNKMGKLYNLILPMLINYSKFTGKLYTFVWILFFSEKKKSPTETALAIVIMIGLYMGLLTIFSFMLVWRLGPLLQTSESPFQLFSIYVVLHCLHILININLMCNLASQLVEIDTLVIWSFR